ncbi:bifunctional DNA-formamidopyrimidine glycosylase/DNA-(apurinic or apyrimidinic site) lyase [Psychrobacter sp. Cmf 22.2]|uniref:bifunctional DNA-formamidopyrimidine glycosylase/DNA-(apurinic or apyrimidinic site) lyase n=1 Tax=Psychrobacter sp. Cmf 22.2 TaxID=1926478 RepID=UPI000946EB69|nr:bifunctional DNA-formamidopyrimidine glycosylase/DNA-(apurinic or apyrimidinic site) lyase [Psychrobacter sp. Cmf 22.2]OLF37085.1 DNA-formamidopyrimidine glycosylase [Psychrobacter sp. Cmf 22.2]
MPELPEVETTKTSLVPLLEQKLTAIQVFQSKLRWPVPDDLNMLTDYTLQDVKRRAKYLILTFVPKAQLIQNSQNAIKHQRQLIIHLGMSGSLQQHPLGTDKRKHDHLIMTFNDSNGIQTQLHYHDPRRFGAVLWYKDYNTKLLAHLGPEPLSEDFTADYLYRLIQRSDDHNISGKTTKQRPITRAIKSVIMEQQVVVGVGNIYATESLYLSAIHPATPAHKLSYEQISILVEHIKVILQRAIELGGSTLRDFTVASGQTGYFQQTFNVYGRQGESCPHCATVLDNIKLNGRASVFCPFCQPIL